MPEAISYDDSLEALVRVLTLLRSGAATTRPELGRRLGFGRTMITQRVSQLLASGIVDETSLAASTGGRPARELRFRAEAGRVLVADIGVSAISAAVADLNGRLLNTGYETCNVSAGPDVVMEIVEQIFDKLTATESVAVWGVGVGIPGPVEYRSGRPVSPPIMPGWDGYPIRNRLADRYNVPAWVDNDVNLMAIGEKAWGCAQHHADFLFIKIGTGIGAGLVSRGRIHRGAQGSAGDVGHIAVADCGLCRCGNIGCLEAVAGGAALARAATDAAQTGQSAILADLLGDKRGLSIGDLVAALKRRDLTSVKLVEQSGQVVGRTIATLVNFYNPSLIVLGGQIADAGDQYLATVRQEIYARSLPLATRDLEIENSVLRDIAGLSGAAAMVIDELFSRSCLARWIEHGTPVGQPGLAAAA